MQRPDLTDSHTIHWHGFDVPSPLNDGVPEVSVAVPIGKQLTYFYRPHREGTYMYHCHFEDVEHVQMGMTGIVFVPPAAGRHESLGGFTKFAYNDGDGSTGYHRHFAILLNEIWTQRPRRRPGHPGDRSRPTTTRSGSPSTAACYPQTVLPNDDADLPAELRIATHEPELRHATTTSQPNSALIQVNPGDRVLLRLANLGYQQHAMQLPGHPDARRRPGRLAAARRHASDTSYWTNTLYLGPGEARDVLFDAPAYNAAPAVRDRTAAAPTTSTTSRTATGAGCRTTAPPDRAE